MKDAIATASPERPVRIRTIVDAIREVLGNNKDPMTARAVYEQIVLNDLYSFNADNPAHVVRSQLRRHCVGMDFSTASSTKYFFVTEDGRFGLAAHAATASKGIRSKSRARQKMAAGRQKRSDSIDGLRWSHSLRELHKKYIDEFKQSVLKRIMRLDPTAFERFSRNLLSAYGFKDVRTTPPSKDGGIDGHGRLKVGLAHMNVAFQCKRWTTGTVGRPEIDRFRGAAQGQYEQGIYFTTSRFTADAQNCSFKPGAVPIILIDGPAIVDIMIEKQFGIEIESLPLYTMALDLALTEASQK